MHRDNDLQVLLHLSNRSSIGLIDLVMLLPGSSQKLNAARDYGH